MHMCAHIQHDFFFLDGRRKEIFHFALGVGDQLGELFSNTYWVMM